MDHLSPSEFEQLKLMLQGVPLPTEAQKRILDKLRSDPDFLASLPGIPKEKFDDNKFLIKYLQDKTNIKKIIDALRSKKIASLSPAQQIELESLLKEDVQEQASKEIPAAYEEPQQQAEEVPQKQEGGMPPFSMGGAGGGYTPSRRVYTVPQQKPDIAIANKSGYVAEKPPSSFVTTDKSGNIQKEVQVKGAPQQAPTPKENPRLVAADRSMAIKEPGNPSQFITPGSAAKGDASKLVSSSGAPLRETAHSGISQGKIISPGRKFNTSFFRSSAGNAFKSLQKFASPANPFLKTNLSRIGQGLGNIVGGLGNFGGRTGLGAINHGANFFGGGRNFMRASRSRMSSLSRSVSPKNMGSKRAALFFGGAFFMIFFMGALSGAGSSPSGTTPTVPAPLPAPGGISDITSCKFFRGQESPQAANFSSQRLLSFITEASQQSTIPPVVLASFIRVESPSSSGKTDAEIAGYAANCAKSPTGALGIMQIQPPGTTSPRGDPASCDDCIDAGAKLVGKTVGTLTTEDYCDPRTNIIIGAGWILKKMSKLGYGDGTKWDPAWTNNNKAIEALVNTYYGGILYPDINTGPFNYADDVSNSIKNCQATPGGTTIADYGIQIEGGFVPNTYKWANEILAEATKVAPKFKGLLGIGTIEIRPTCGVSNTQGRIIYLRNQSQFCTAGTSDGPTANENLFKQVFIHELGHIVNGSGRPGVYGDRIKEAIKKEGYLTQYSASASPDDDEICGNGKANDPKLIEDTRADEDFAETVSYFINYKTGEQDYGCNTKSGGQNPFELSYSVDINGKTVLLPIYSSHKQLAEELLK